MPVPVESGLSPREGHVAREGQFHLIDQRAAQNLERLTCGRE